MRQYNQLHRAFSTSTKTIKAPTPVFKEFQSTIKQILLNSISQNTMFFFKIQFTSTPQYTAIHTPVLHSTLQYIHQYSTVLQQDQHGASDSSPLICLHHLTTQSLVVSSSKLILLYFYAEITSIFVYCNALKRSFLLESLIHKNSN